MLRGRDVRDGLDAARFEFMSQHSNFAFIAVAQNLVSDDPLTRDRSG